MLILVRILGDVKGINSKKGSWCFGATQISQISDHIKMLDITVALDNDRDLYI